MRNSVREKRFFGKRAHLGHPWDNARMSRTHALQRRRLVILPAFLASAGILACAEAPIEAPAVAQTAPSAPASTWSSPAKPSAQRGNWQTGLESVDLSWARTAKGEYIARFDLTMKSGWHTYWKDPGESGDAPQIQWTLPPGWKAGAIQYPRPEAKIVDGLPFFGYETKATYLVPLTPPSGDAPKAAPFKVTCSVLICKSICVQGAFDFTGTLPPAAPEAKIALDTERFNGRTLPQDAAAAGVTAQLDSNKLTITGPAQGQTSARFILARAPGISLTAPASETGIVPGSVKGDRFELIVQLERTPADSSGRLSDAEGLILLGDAPSSPSVYVRVPSGKPKPAG